MFVRGDHTMNFVLRVILNHIHIEFLGDVGIVSRQVYIILPLLEFLVEVYAKILFLQVRV